MIRIALLLATIGSAYAMHAQNTFLLDSTIRFDYINGDSIPSIKNEYIYDELGRLIQEIESNLPLVSLKWEQQNRQTYHYIDDTRLRDTMTSWQFDTDQWIPVSRTLYQYTGGTLSQTIGQEWNDNNQSWSNVNLTYNLSAIPGYSYSVNARWDTLQSRWQPVDSTVIHSLSEYLKVDTIYSWIDIAQTYVQSRATISRFDSTGNIVVNERYIYDFDDTVFVPRSRDTFAYDENGFRILSQFDTWLSPLKIWEPSLRIERIPNSDGFLAQSSLFFFDFVSQLLRPTSRLEYTYTDGKARSEADSLIHTVKNFVYQGPFEIPDYIRIYYYQENNLTATINSPPETVAVFPNPASENVFLQGNSNFSKFRWLDVTGRILASGTIRQENIIPVPPHIKGTLILQLHTLGRKAPNSYRVIIQ